MKKRIFVALLCLVLLCCFVACDVQFGGLVGELFGSGDVGGDIHLPPEEYPTSSDILWDEPYVEIETVGPQVELDTDLYRGKVFTILGDSMQDLGMNGDFISEVIYERSLLVEEKYGVMVSSKYLSSEWVITEVGNAVQAGSSDYDAVIANMTSVGVDLTMYGGLTDMRSLPYLDLSSSHWDANISEGLGFGNYLPMITGEMVPSSDLATALIVFNAPMVEEMGYDLYDYVEVGGWTLSKMYAFVENMYVDLDGDAEKTYDDRYGMIFTHMDANAFECGADVMLVSKNDQNMPSMTLELTEQMSEAYANFYKLVSGNGTLHFREYETSKQPDIAAEVFDKGNSMLYATTLQDAMQLSNMRGYYGILPYPKMNEEQESYQSYVTADSCALMVPKGIGDAAFIGYVLEAMAQESDGLIRSRIQVKECRSEKDATMLQLVLDTKTMNFGSVYLIGMMDEQGAAVQYFRGSVESYNSSADVSVSLTSRPLAQMLQELCEMVKNHK